MDCARFNKFGHCNIGAFGEVCRNARQIRANSGSVEQILKSMMQAPKAIVWRRPPDPRRLPGKKYHEAEKMIARTMAPISKRRNEA
jgi:hypothetical protein